MAAGKATKASRALAAKVRVQPQTAVAAQTVAVVPVMATAATPVAAAHVVVGTKAASCR